MSQRPTTSEGAAPPAPDIPIPPPPGTFAHQKALFWVPLTEEERGVALARFRPDRRIEAVPFSALATLKILLPEESASLIVSPLGAEMVQEVLSRVLSGLITGRAAARQET